MILESLRREWLQGIAFAPVIAALVWLTCAL